MSFSQFDRFAICMQPLSARANRKNIVRDHVSPDAEPRDLDTTAQALIRECGERVRQARRHDRPVMIAFGAHAIKNGLAPVFLRLIEGGWVTHLATNGAGIIHDWEFAFQGKSCEDVALMVQEGRFGNWEETGFYINLALNVGAYEGRGYGESVGALIQNEGLSIPSTDELENVVRDEIARQPETAAGAADLLGVLQKFDLPSGALEVPHPWKKVQHSSRRLPSRHPVHRTPDDWARYYL